MIKWTVNDFADWLILQKRTCESASTEAQRDRAYAYQNALDVLRGYHVTDKPDSEDQPAPPAESLHEMAKRLCSGGRHCIDCPIGEIVSDTWCLIMHLRDAKMANEQIDALHRWAAENPPAPVRTYLEDFFERNKGAMNTSKGTPVAMLRHIYYVCDSKMHEYRRATEHEAWNMPLGYWEEEAKDNG